MSTGFLTDIVTHLTTFAASKGIKTEDADIRITLADNSSFIVHGLKTTGAVRRPTALE